MLLLEGKLLVDTGLDLPIYCLNTSDYKTPVYCIHEYLQFRQ